MTTAGTNVAAVGIPDSGYGDCLNWIVTAAEVGVRACRPVSVEPGSWGRIKAFYR